MGTSVYSFIYQRTRGKSSSADGQENEEVQEVFTESNRGCLLVQLLCPTVQPLFSCCVQLFVTPWTAAHQSSLSFTISQSLRKLMTIESVMPSNHLILCHPPFAFNCFQHQGLFHPALCIRWPKYWSFSFNISPFNEYSELISFSIDWFDLEVQGTLKGLLQHHSSRASILGFLAFLMLQVSHPYMTTGKTMALTTQTFVSKVMSLLFNMLSRFYMSRFNMLS